MTDSEKERLHLRQRFPRISSLIRVTIPSRNSDSACLGSNPSSAASETRCVSTGFNFSSYAENRFVSNRVQFFLRKSKMPCKPIAQDIF
jgi:hypothetical protein